MESGWASDSLLPPPVLIHDFTPPRYTSLGTLVGAGGKHTCRCRPDEHDGELRQQAAERRRLPPDLQRQKKWLRKESLLVPRAAEVSPPEGEGEAHPSNGDEREEGRWTHAARGLCSLTGVMCASNNLKEMTEELSFHCVPTLRFCFSVPPVRLRSLRILTRG